MAERRFVPYVTIVLAALNLAGFAIELAAGGDVMWGPTPLAMFGLGGNFGPETLGGEQWRLFTSMFLHYGILHLAANMYFGLYMLGRGVEGMYGHAGYAALYLVSGLAGSLVSAVRGTGVSAGASGAVFGIIGALAAFLLIHRKRIAREALRQQVSSLAFLIAISLYLGFQSKVIDMGAHVGGLIAGFVLGIALEAGHRAHPGLGRRKRTRAIVVGVAGAALVFGATFVAPNPGERLLGDPVPASVRTAEQAIERLKTLPEAEQLAAIETTALPAWRTAVGDVERAVELPDDAHALLLRYTRGRRDQLDYLAQSARTGDDRLHERSVERGRDADAAVTELNAMMQKK
jgi:rhomboid protease GluP